MTRALVPSRKVMVLFFGLRSGAAVEPDRSFLFRLRRSFLMERRSDKSESGECGLVHGSLRVPLRRWVGREVCIGCYDRSLRCLRYDVAVSIHLHEGCVEGSGHLM